MSERRTVTVSEEWFKAASEAMRGKNGCPFCGSDRPPIVSSGDERFLSRAGCLDCDRWFGPPEPRG